MRGLVARTPPPPPFFAHILCKVIFSSVNLAVGLLSFLLSSTFNSHVTPPFIQLSLIYWLFFTLIFLHTCVPSSSSPSSSLSSSPGLILDWSLSLLYPGNLSPPVCKEPLMLWSSTNFPLVLSSPLTNFFAVFFPPSDFSSFLLHQFVPSISHSSC